MMPKLGYVLILAILYILAGCAEPSKILSDIGQQSDAGSFVYLQDSWLHTTLSLPSEKAWPEVYHAVRRLGFNVIGCHQIGQRVEIVAESTDAYQRTVVKVDLYPISGILTHIAVDVRRVKNRDWSTAMLIMKEIKEIKEGY